MASVPKARRKRTLACVKSKKLNITPLSIQLEIMDFVVAEGQKKSPEQRQIRKSVLLLLPEMGTSFWVSGSVNL